MKTLNDVPLLSTSGTAAHSSGEVRIPLPDRFTFQSHREFRAAYSSCAGSNPTYVVDFDGTHFIDSAGLGMLLQLLEYANNDRERVRFVNCTSDIRATLTIAGFEELATLS